MGLEGLYDRAADEFGRRVHAVASAQWHAPTPDDEWDVRELVNHLVNENRWAPPLLAGRTIEEVGDTYDGDLLGDDPLGAWDESIAQSAAAVAAVDMERPVHLSFGTVPAEEYVAQLVADLVVHGWDLAVAIGVGVELDPELVVACGAWFADREDLYRQGGVIGARVAVPDDADEQTKLLAAFGRDAGWKPPA
jgi:uncharacterized protein (TIGR03086 family)